eukprot:1307140-Amphidinium_carterae.1
MSLWTYFSNGVDGVRKARCVSIASVSCRSRLYRTASGEYQLCLVGIAKTYHVCIWQQFYYCQVALLLSIEECPCLHVW